MAKGLAGPPGKPPFGPGLATPPGPRTPDLGVLFVRMDRNGDGVLSVKEFVEGMTFLRAGMAGRFGGPPAAKAAEAKKAFAAKQHAIAKAQAEAGKKKAEALKGKVKKDKAKKGDKAGDKKAKHEKAAGKKAKGEKRGDDDDKD